MKMSKRQNTSLAAASDEEIVSELIRRIGETPEREGLEKTPHRVVKSWKEIYGGYKQKPEDVLKTDFSKEGYDGVICSDRIDFYSTCEHHMLPFVGHAHIGYIPGKRVVGLSKLSRIVEVYARRMQIQERLTEQIAEAIQTVLKPKGVAVFLRAEHFCMKCRGVNKQNSSMVTISLRGVFKKDASTKAEFLSLIRHH